MVKHPTPSLTMGRKLAVVTAAAATLALAPASLALADSGKPAAVTPATGFHGLPGNNGGELAAHREAGRRVLGHWFLREVWLVADIRGRWSG